MGIRDCKNEEALHERCIPLILSFSPGEKGLEGVGFVASRTLLRGVTGRGKEEKTFQFKSPSPAGRGNKGEGNPTCDQS